MEISDSIISQINDIRKDSSSGANELALKAVKVIQDQLDSIRDPNENIKDLIYKLVDKLIKTRPSMAPLINSMGFLITYNDKFTKKSISNAIKAYYSSQAIKESLLEQNFKLMLNKMGKSELRIMLISYSSTILNLILKNTENTFTFYILESRPLFEGQKLAEMLSEKYETHLIIDAAAGKFINNIDLIFIGADSILQDGSIINKIGTYPLAVLANSNHKDMYVISDSYKYNLFSHYGYKVEIEPKPIKQIYDKQIKIKNFRVENFYFDITPSHFIKAIVSDLGILSIENFLKKVKIQIPIKWFMELME